MPESFRKIAEEKALISGKPLVFVMADMDENCDFRDHAFLLCDDSVIHAFSNEIVTQREISRSGAMKKDFTNFTFEKIILSDVKEIFTENLIVGGTLCIKYTSGNLVRLCAYTNGFKKRITVLNEIGNSLINGEEISEDKLFEEVKRDVCPKCGKPYPDPHFHHPCLHNCSF